MRSLKEWADMISQARIVRETREKKEAAVQLTRALVTASETEYVKPLARRVRAMGSAWYAIGMKSFQNLTLAADDNDDVRVTRSCEVCAHLYAIDIKAWKIRSCDVAAAPCPKCSAFQIVDLDVLRKERFGAC